MKGRGTGKDVESKWWKRDGDDTPEWISTLQFLNTITQLAERRASASRGEFVPPFGQFINRQNQMEKCLIEFRQDSCPYVGGRTTLGRSVRVFFCFFFLSETNGNDAADEENVSKRRGKTIRGTYFGHVFLRRSSHLSVIIRVFIRHLPLVRAVKWHITISRSLIPIVRAPLASPRSACHSP